MVIATAPRRDASSRETISSRSARAAPRRSWPVSMQRPRAMAEIPRWTRHGR